MKAGGRVMEFEKIYNTYFKSVYLYILKLSGNEHLAEEIASETFLKAMKSIGDFRGECDIRVWLCQIAKNASYSYLKGNNKIANVDEAELQNIIDPNTSVEEKLGMQESLYVACIWRIVF